MAHAGRKARTAAGDALVAVGLLLACGLIGFSLLPARARERARLALPLSLSLGVTAVGWESWLAGSLAGTRATLPLLAILVLQSLRIWRRYGRACLRWARTVWLLARSHPWLAAALMLVVAALGPQLLLPVTDSDGLRYRLALPKLFVLTGTVFRYQYDFTGGLPQLAEMLYLHTLQLGRAETAKLLHTGMFLGTLAVLAAVVHRGPGPGRPRCSRRWPGRRRPWRSPLQRRRSWTTLRRFTAPSPCSWPLQALHPCSSAARSAAPWEPS